jgi:hypothetical protein
MKTKSDKQKLAQELKRSRREEVRTEKTLNELRRSLGNYADTMPEIKTLAKVLTLLRQRNVRLAALEKTDDDGIPEKLRRQNSQKKPEVVRREVRPNQSPLTTRRFYHRTTASNAEQILMAGFRDSTGYYLTATKHTGVWVSNEPLSSNEGANGDTLLEVTTLRTEAYVNAEKL